MSTSTHIVHSLSPTLLLRTPFVLPVALLIAASSSACTDDGDPIADETAETSGDGDPGDGDGDPGDGDGDPGDEMRVSNTEPDCIDGYVAPALPSEASHLTATILTPEVYPFEVTRIRYVLGGPGAMDFCNGSLGHRVDLFVSEGSLSAMPSQTEPFVGVEVPADPMAVEGRTVELELDSPVSLDSGQALVVAIEMRGDDELDTRLCVALCEPNGPALEGVDWWSNAADEPYEWADLVADFGFPDNATVEAFGVVSL